MSNQEVRRVNTITNKIIVTPTMTALELIEELDDLSTEFPINGSFGLLVKSIIYKVHTNLKV